LVRVRVDWRKAWTRGSGGREERAYSKEGSERRRSWEMRSRKAEYSVESAAEEEVMM
jgi:hypothetical protein